MKDTKTILAMLAKAREDILDKKSSQNKTGDAFVVYMKKKGHYGAKEVFAYNWNGNRDNIDELFDATQMQGWYIARVSKRCRWSNYTDMTIYLEQSADGFTTNVDVDVIDALKEMTTMMTNFTPDPAKIEARKAMTQEAYPWNLARFLTREDSGNNEWFVYTDDKWDFYTSGHPGATGAIKYLAEKAKTHRLSAWKGKYGGFTKIWLTKINYNTPTNLTPEVLKRLATLADTKGIAQGTIATNATTPSQGRVLFAIIYEQKGDTSMDIKEYTVWFQVMGNYTVSNNIGRGFVRATSKEEALKFAEEDLKRGMFKDIEIDCDGTLEDSEKTDDDGNTSYSWNVNWGGTGKHGRYYATGGPYAKNEEDAIALQKKELTSPDWFYGFEDELTIDDEQPILHAY